MEITEVKVFPVNEEKLKAFVSIVFDRCFMVNDIKIIQGRDGLFISMPSRKKKNGEFKDIAHPLNNDTRRRIELDVVDEYERVLAQRGESLPAPARAHKLGTSSGDEAASGDGSRSGDGDAAENEPGDTGEKAPEAAESDAPERTPDAAPVAAAATDNGDGSSPESKGDDGTKDDDSLEEVQEKHLRDSFWSVS